jgi:hypothetical protein
LLCAAQSLSGRQLRDHGPESDAQSLTGARASSFRTTGWPARSH